MKCRTNKNLISIDCKYSDGTTLEVSKGIVVSIVDTKDCRSMQLEFCRCTNSDFRCCRDTVNSAYEEICHDPADTLAKAIAYVGKMLNVDLDNDVADRVRQYQSDMDNDVIDYKDIEKIFNSFREGQY